MSVIVNPSCPALRIVVDGIEAWRLAVEAGPKRAGEGQREDQYERHGGDEARTPAAGLHHMLVVGSTSKSSGGMKPGGIHAAETSGFTRVISGA
jgi:hypothetical protein